jgi:hypothetical protein
MLVPFEHFIVNVSKSYPFKGARAGYVCLFWLDSSSSQWVNTESDSPSTESTRSQSPCQLSQCRVRLHVNWVNAEDTNIYKDFLILHWLSWRGVPLRVDSVDMESHWRWLSCWGMRLRVNWVDIHRYRKNNVPIPKTNK